MLKLLINISGEFETCIIYMNVIKETIYNFSFVTVQSWWMLRSTSFNEKIENSVFMQLQN